MEGTRAPTVESRRREPWFAQHPRMALSVAVVLFATVFALRLAVEGTADSITFLYVLPVSLVALAFGFRAGVAAGVVAVALLVAWVAIGDEQLSVLGWVTRIVPLLLLGALVGASADRIGEAREAERYAYAISLMQRDAAEVNDSVVQGLAAVRWLLESGQVDRALAVLDETSAAAQGLVSRVLGAGSPLTDDVRKPHRVLRHHSPPS